MMLAIFVVGFVLFLVLPFCAEFNREIGSALRWLLRWPRRKSDGSWSVNGISLPDPADVNWAPEGEIDNNYHFAIGEVRVWRDSKYVPIVVGGIAINGIAAERYRTLVIRAYASRLGMRAVKKPRPPGKLLRLVSGDSGEK